ncbi:DUF5677 domain-containing protein [Cohnella faecalis]|uniref:DUF5677 domain-containing protein n=1 Tax=Cohnella faecalis TaxID=2315694 RepID=UPI00360EF224
MIILARQDLVNDFYMLSRGFVERLVNFCYLLVCDESKYKVFMLHTSQKAYRKLDRSITIPQGSVQIKFSGQQHVTIPNLQESIDLFTSKSGKEISHWTKVSLDDRKYI